MDCGGLKTTTLKDLCGETLGKKQGSEVAEDGEEAISVKEASSVLDLGLPPGGVGGG